ncbi:hypothetical protein DUT91_01805 [Phyllobacterium salinisoli]|uniref:Lipoprotein n=1 Tax=Phyllobacterium salinisoli TaxID=1899321 RepID=A0A368K868_9HYPH|nr:hypothetical protein [Phyllobacterium salinisoli]RCS25549.1 hypothetical protein DUT91_01805 [Phyllobacterium salinisoli]
MKKQFTSIVLLLAGALAACNSTEATLSVPSSGGTAASGATTGQAAGQTATQPGTGSQTAGTLRLDKLQIAPIVGAPVSVVTPLSRRLAADAKAKGVTLAGPNEAGQAYVMKGYFSALAENNETTVLYVWDILDPSGNRLHRIQGQEKVAGSAPDSWSAVPASAMEAIAGRTMQEYASWLAANRAPAAQTGASAQ